MSNLEIALLSAGIASGLTFVATRVSDFLNRLKKRNVQNFNALVKLEHLINEYGMIVNDNKQNMEIIASAISKPNALPMNRLTLIDVNTTVKIHLLDIKLINQIVEIEYSLRRFNDDTRMINFHLNEFQRAVLGGSLPQLQYNVFTRGLIGEAAQYQLFMDDFLDKLAGLAAYVQLREESDCTWTIRLLNFLAHVRKPAIKTSEIKKRKKKILNQLEKSQQDSIKEKEKILSRKK